MGDLIAKSPSSLSLLAPALSKALERVGEGTIQLSVSLRDDDEVQSLRSQIRVLESELEAERAIRIRAENKFADESYINNALIDLIRDYGVPVPGHLFRKPRP